MVNELFKEVLADIDIKKEDVKEYSPLVLAYLGDAVYEIFIRTLVLSKENAPAYKLHRLSTEYVKAKAQSDVIHRIYESLTAEEQDIVKRGRNAKSGTAPKNADIIEYRYATGFESLLGYLYLNQDFTRMVQILKMCTQN